MRAPQFDQRWASRMPPGFVPKKFLGIEVTVRVITHAFRFAARLLKKAFDADENTAKVTIMLTGTRDRVLVRRADTSLLDDWYIASAASLENTWPCKCDELRSNPDGFAVKAALWFFERFNWVNATEELVARTQTRVFTGA